MIFHIFTRINGFNLYGSSFRFLERKRVTAGFRDTSARSLKNKVLNIILMCWILRIEPLIQFHLQSLL